MSVGTGGGEDWGVGCPVEVDVVTEVSQPQGNGREGGDGNSCSRVEG